jgi:hypothetical protein
MIKDGLVKSTRINLNTPLFFQLPDVKAPSVHSYQHEHACAEIYVSYATTGKLQYWNYGFDEEMKDLGLKPDRTSIINGQIVFWEVDRGTETLPVIQNKLERYIKLSRNHQPFLVVFTASARRATSMMTLFQKARCRFYTAEFEQVLSNPLGEILLCPWSPACKIG